MTDNDLDRLLSFDPLGAAEELTGHSYKEDDGTQALGFLLLQSNSQAKKDALQATNDTYWMIDFLDAVDVALDLGFTPIYAQALPDKGFHPGTTVHWQAYWRDGILLVLESYNDHLNKANMYFNWRNNSGETTWLPWDLGLSGGWDRRTRVDGRRAAHDEDIPGDPWTLVVHTDVREGFRRKLERIEEMDGYILPEWYIRPFLHFVSHADESDKTTDDYKTLTREKIERFDPTVRDIILSASER